MLGWYIFSLSLWKPEEKKDWQGDTVYVKTVKEETERDEYVNKAKAKKSGQMADDGFKALEDSLDNWITMDQPSSSNLATKDGKKIRKNKGGKGKVAKVIAGGKESKETKKEKDSVKQMSSLETSKGKGLSMVKLASDISTKCLKQAGKIKQTKITGGMIAQLRARQLYMQFPRCFPD